MKNIWSASVALLLVAHDVVAGQSIRGRVVDDSTGAPIPGASVEVTAPNGVLLASTVAAATGAFAINLNVAGQFRVGAKHLGYMSAQPSEVTFRREITTIVELRLGQRAIPLRPLVVSAERNQRTAGFYERMERPGAGRFLDRARISQRHGARTTDLVSEVPGVELLRMGGGLRPRTSLIAMRGISGSCLPTIYLDGLPIEQSRDNGLDDFLRPEMLEGVEIYNGATTAPPPIEARSNCGVVAFWTRPVEVEKAWSARRLLIGGGALATMGLFILLSR